MREETGYDCSVTGDLGLHEFLVRTEHAGTDYTHHIAIFRAVELQGRVGLVDREVTDREGMELNDSSGPSFLRLDEDPDVAACSPLVRRCFAILRGGTYPSDLELIDRAT